MKVRALRNRTLTCNETEIAKLSESLIQLSSPTSVQYITDKIIHQDFIEACHFLPERFVDLLIVDPPYNLTKNYNGHLFRSKQAEDYVTWFEDIVTSFMTILRPNATVYVCSDWKTSNLIFPVLDRYFHVRNRITWEDITIPFWSMTENTDHPTQKPEKLIAKLVIASSRLGDFIFDPFLGSGTTAVVARKLNRHFSGIELNKEYCCWAAKRLQLAREDETIQGYSDGVFWERNSLNDQPKKQKPQWESIQGTLL